MRCPDCNKFVAFDSEQEPEVQVDMTDEMATVEVRIVNNCEECGTELKEATFDLDHDCSDVIKDHKCEEPYDLSADLSFSCEETGSERISRQGYYGKGGAFIPKGGRYGKMFYGASVTCEVKCDRCDKVLGEFTVEDYCQASSMDELT